MPRTPLTLDGQPLSIDDVREVAVGLRDVVIGDHARAHMQAARDVVERALTRGTPVYGLTTAFGALKHIDLRSPDVGSVVERHASDDERQDIQATFNRVAVLSHLVGHGPPVPESVVRAAMLVRAQGFVQGRSGARPALADAYVAALNAHFHPPVRPTGSLGMSDLAPLAEIAYGLMGDGDQGSALLAAGLTPIVPQAKEAIAMMSANAFSVGWGALALADAEGALDGLDAAAALSFEGVLANTGALRREVVEARPYPGAIATLERLRGLLSGGDLLDGDGDVARELQDPLSFRVVPQTHGAARDALAHARGQLEIELGSAGDNPFVSIAADELVSAGNFDSTPVALAIDYARLGLAHAVTLGAERVQKLLTERFTGLPTHLRASRDDPGDGYAMLGYTAAAAAGELRLLAAPVSLEAPTSSIDEGVDDRIVLTALAARRLAEMVPLAHHVSAAELVCAAHAVDLRDRRDRLGSGTRRIYDTVRGHVSFSGTSDGVIADLVPLEQQLSVGIGLERGESTSRSASMSSTE